MYHLPKTNILRERTIRTSTTVQARLGSSSGLLDSIATFDDFLDALAAERLRFMPHDGSQWDKVLRWAEGFAGYVYIFHDAVSGFMLHSEDATKMIWSSVLALLQMGPRQATVLTKSFSVFHQLGLSISLFLRQENLITATAEIRRELAHAYSDLVELTCAVGAHYLSKSHGTTQISCDDFAEHFEKLVAAFYAHRDRVSDAMWTAHLQGFDEENNFDIGEIRRFLEPADHSVCKIIASRASSSTSRTEFTFEWFLDDLWDFTWKRNNILLITGGPGCGKSMLAGWIVEQLQSSIDQSPYDVIYYRVERDIPSTTSALNVVKGLLLQTFDTRIGHEALLVHIRQAIELSTTGKSAKEVEDTLWHALEHVAQHAKLMFVVDGLDQLSGGQTSALAILERLHQLTVKEGNTDCKAIVLSQPLQKAAPSLTRHVAIKNSNVSEDIQRFITNNLDSSSFFEAMSHKDKEAVAHKVSEKSNGSFLWAALAFRSLKHEETFSGFMQYLDKAPKSVEGFYDYDLHKLQLERSETRAILSWIIAAERPLALQEIKHLLEIDTNHCRHSPRYGNISDVVRRACGSLVTVQDGFVSLRHSSMRHHLSKCKTDKFHFDMRRAQSSLALGCLAYVKIHVHKNFDVSFKQLAVHDVYDLFKQYQMLEYCTMYWTTHMKASAFYQTNGEVQVSPKLKSCFPSSVLLAMLEQVCLQLRFTSREMETYSLIAYKLRKAVLGESASASLQSLLYVIQVYQAINSVKTAEFAYDAWRISQTSGDIAIVVVCAEAFIASTTSTAVTKRTKLVEQREEVLKFIITAHRHTHGASHDLTIKYTKLLAELYVSVQKVEEAVVLYRELYEVTIERHGYFHKETEALYEVLMARLKALSKLDVILSIHLSYHEHVVKTLAITDERRIKSTLTLVRMYEGRREVTKAEEILVSYWRSITTSTSSSTAIETRVDVAIEYSRFLTRHSRRDEAEVIMRAVWTEVAAYQKTKHTESITRRIKSIAEEFKSLKVFSMARSIFTSLWKHCKETEQSSAIAVEIATSLAETVTETITTTTEKTTTTTTELLTVEEETVLREVFESTLSVSASSKSSSLSVSTATIKTCTALATSYVKQERWSEALEVYSKALSQTWSSVESASATELTTQHSEEVIQTAMSLAECHFKQLRVDKAEAIYRNVFATLAHFDYDQQLLVRTAREVIAFHERTFRYELALATYRDFAACLQRRLGKSHTLTIETFVAYGTLARRLGKLKEAEEAYQAVYSAYQAQDGTCRVEGIEAALVLCELHEQRGGWAAAREVYACLWQTFRQHGKSYKLQAAFAERVYERYMHVLEHKVKAESVVTHRLASEYRETCVSLYGAESAQTLTATVRLAQICERSEESYQQSVELYEEVLKQSKTISKTSTTTTVLTHRQVAQATQRLAQMYASKSSTIERAVSLYASQYEASRTERGYTATETLSLLHQLVHTYTQQNTTEATAKATSTLQTAVFGVFKQETHHSERLIAAAQALASTYVAHGLESHALTLMQELRCIIIDEARAGKTVKTTQRTFFAAFAEVLLGGSRSFTAIMAELRSEILLYEAWFHVSKTEVQQRGIMGVLERGARLRLVLIEADHGDEAKQVEEELLATFRKAVGSQEVDGQAYHALFTLVLSLLSDEETWTTILSRTVDTVAEHTRADRFHAAHELGVLVHRLVHVQGGFATQADVLSGLRLGLYLAGRVGAKPCPEEKRHAQMMQLSALILREALEAARQTNLSFATLLDIKDASALAATLGAQANFADLDHVLTALHSSPSTSSSKHHLSLLLALIHARFALATPASTTSALHLAQTLHYNLARIHGPLAPPALAALRLEAAMLASRGKHDRAAALHAAALGRLAWDAETEVAEACAGLDGAAAVACREMEALRRAWGRAAARGQGAPDKKSAYAELLDAVARRFAGFDACKADKVRKLLDVQTWAPLPEKEDDGQGLWERPTSFGFVDKEGIAGIAGLVDDNAVQNTAGAGADGKAKNRPGLRLGSGAGYARRSSSNYAVLQRSLSSGQLGSPRRVGSPLGSPLGSGGAEGMLSLGGVVRGQ
ncbi:uncharacterized protein K452DRAFT_235652 [Aplosporella prunicola CBS 121167]|uniref:Uncharacterized protein n=1 Tax=Aplosporella prunicola CBS 121167 TaxID=1176127 RepID=A0A6A6B1J8_9PEZI|nr:uncharacterized protein K452DRAFT_235652 [Aplosporella prunicola CBS 121167]KAF2137458.1 hypothetical protein K452DRAFT_235652 [Aplosporella prunicola CBS 121167]